MPSFLYANDDITSSIFYSTIPAVFYQNTPHFLQKINQKKGVFVNYYCGLLEMFYMSGFKKGSPDQILYCK